MDYIERDVDMDGDYSQYPMEHGGMDHGGMGHGGMDHGGMDHGGMDMGDGQCSMNMLFTWSTENLCIVFRGWRVTGPWTLILSLLGVIALSACYEGIRELSRRYEASHNEYVNSLPINDDGDVDDNDDNDNERRSWRWLGRNQDGALKRAKLVKAIFYAVQVFYSFFIMLLFMTYNGWIMIAVAVGAFIGFLAFGHSPATKDVSCH